MPTIAQARNPRLLKALKQDMHDRNIVIIENSELRDIKLLQGRIQSIDTASGCYPINHLVMTAGAWSGQLWQTIIPETGNNHTEIHPVKGQMLLYDTQPGTLPSMVLDDHCYLIPRADGKILVGSTVESSGFNKEITHDAKQHLSSFACKLFPTLSRSPLIDHWAGLRPGTRQGIPYIDTHPTINNLSINAGHFRNGLAMGPASAQLLVDQILNRPACVPPEPYRLNVPH